MPSSASALMARALIACALPALLLLALPAAAVTTVPAPGVVATVLFNRGIRIDPTAFGTYSVPAPGGGMTLVVQGEPFPAVQADGRVATDASTALFFGSSSGILSYFVGVDGPINTQVRVLVDVAGFATGLASAGATFAVGSGWELLVGNTFLALDSVESGQQTGSFSQGFSRTVELMLDTQSVYRVNLRATVAVAATDNNAAAQGSAFIDPFFRFGSEVDTSVYRFVFSAGVGNQPVPEVPSALLLVCGLAMLVARRLCSTA